MQEALCINIYTTKIYTYVQHIYYNRITREYYYLDSTKDEKRVSKGGRFFPLTSELKNSFEYIREKTNRAWNRE